MTIKNSDMPAMPCDKSIDTKENWEDLTAGGRFVPADGLTKREMFAMKAMQGLITTQPHWDIAFDEVAQLAVKHADALLKELEK